MTADIKTASGIVSAQTPVILSASRSTDIPAYYGEWFMNRIRAGWCAWVNPFNRRPVYVSFRDVRAIVFWTKNPAPFIKHLDELDARGLNYYFQYTLNDYEQEAFEPNVPALEKRIAVFRSLSERIGPERVVWRFDPIILTPTLSPRDILMRIWKIGKKLRGLTSKLVVSFVDVGEYKKVQNNLIRETSFFTKDNVLAAEPIASQREEICVGLQKIRERWLSEGWKIDIATCAEIDNLEQFGIEHNKCIDDGLLRRCFGKDEALVHFLDTGKSLQESVDKAKTPMTESLFAGDVIPIAARRAKPNLKDKGQRKECGCIASKDIGMYNTCMHFCVYCYANASRTAVLANRKKHDPASPFLIGEPSGLAAD